MNNLENMTKEELIGNIMILNKAIDKLANKVANAEVNLALMEAQIPEKNESQEAGKEG
ncbi:hypothetical protein AALF85_05435 [Jeotgalicoccus halotolerans]|uniref:hypothetical protein n=1 Tax=Jeotgalicoccus halotolerans TaxID=157227 RepID=UPI00351993E8